MEVIDDKVTVVTIGAAYPITFVPFAIHSSCFMTACSFNEFRISKNVSMFLNHVKMYA